MLKSILFLLLPYLATSQSVLFYNVENLFDTLHDYGHADEDFLPEGPRQNNSITYWLKIRQTASALRLAYIQSPTPPISYRPRRGGNLRRPVGIESTCCTVFIRPMATGAL